MTLGIFACTSADSTQTPAQEASSGWYSLDRPGCPDCSGKGPAARAWAAAHTAAEVETAEVTRAEAAARAAETPEETEAREFREEAARAEVARQAAADKIVKARRKLLDDGRIFADIFCAEQVEARSRFSARWTDSFLENKFPVGQWQKETASEKIVLYMGDKIEIQNRFGAWQPHLYECLVDVRREKILSVNVVPRS